MARANGKKVNTSAAIREYVTANPDVGPTEAAAAVSKKIGKTIPPSYISNVKNLMAGGKTKKRRTIRRKAALGRRAKHGTTFSMENLQSVKSLVADLGADGVKQLVEAVS